VTVPEVVPFIKSVPVVLPVTPRVAEVNTPVVGVVAPTVPFMFMEAVPVRFVTVPEDGVPRAPSKVTKAPALHTLTARAVATFVPSHVIPPTATFVAVAAFPVQLPELPETFPVTFPVRGHENPVAESIDVLELNVRPAFVFGHRSPVAAVKNQIKHEVSVASFATVIAVGVHPADASKVGAEVAPLLVRTVVEAHKATAEYTPELFL